MSENIIKNDNNIKEDIDKTCIISKNEINDNLENDNENYTSLLLKYEKLNRDYKNLETKLNNTIEINKDNYSKMEQHYKDLIFEKENKIKESENKLSKIENSKLLENNKKGNEGKESISSLEGILDDFIKNINKTLTDNKIIPDYIENISNNIENKINNMINDINNYIENKLKLFDSCYQKRIEKIINDNSKLRNELLTEKYGIIDIKVKEKIKDDKIIGLEDQIKELKIIIDSKDSIIKTEQDKNNILNTEYSNLQRECRELQSNYNQSVFAFKMKEDEVDTLIMIIDATLNSKRGKYLHNLNKLSEDIRQEVEDIINSLKIFKKK